MNIIKRIAVVVLVWTAGQLFADRQIGVVPDFVKDESDILKLGVDEDNVPVLLILKKKERILVLPLRNNFLFMEKKKWTF